MGMSPCAGIVLRARRRNTRTSAPLMSKDPRGNLEALRCVRWLQVTLVTRYGTFPNGQLAPDLGRPHRGDDFVREPAMGHHSWPSAGARSGLAKLSGGPGRNAGCGQFVRGRCTRSTQPDRRVDLPVLVHHSTARGFEIAGLTLPGRCSCTGGCRQPGNGYRRDQHRASSGNRRVPLRRWIGFDHRFRVCEPTRCGPVVPRQRMCNSRQRTDWSV